MAGYLVEITRDEDGLITDRTFNSYVSNSTTKPRGGEFQYIDSPLFKFPEITLDIDDNILIGNDGTAQTAQDALDLVLSNLKADVLALDMDALTITGDDQEDIRKLLKLIALILATQ